MAQTAVDCCNSALQRVGASPIMSLSDNTPESRACSIAYDSNRRDELRRHPYAFARKRVVLAPDSTAPVFDYLYQFSLPVDCLRIIRPPDFALDWQIEGRKILTNDGDTLYLKYIADIEDTAQWDATFYNLVAAGMAVDLCERLTQSNTKKQQLLAEYELATRAARRVNAFESGPQENAPDSWWVSRL